MIGRESAQKVELRSGRLRPRFAHFAGECVKKYLAHAGTSEIIGGCFRDRLTMFSG